MQHHDHNLQVNKIAIIGTPNVGKSSLFNQITRSYSLVANLPHTTIEIQRAPMLIGGKHYEIIDTPGIQSLNSESEDSLVTRSILLEEHPEIIVLCLDATNVKRSLQFAAQIFELDIPLVVCLNFTDESRQKGLVISRKKLEALLGVPVIETVAAEGRGIKELLRAFARARTAQGATVRYKHFIETCLDELSACFPEDAVPSDGILLLLLTDAPGIQNRSAAHGDGLGGNVFDATERRGGVLPGIQPQSPGNLFPVLEKFQDHYPVGYLNTPFHCLCG